MRLYIAGLATLAFISSVAPTQAGWPWSHQAAIEKARNNAWPQPFRAADTASVVAPFEIMKNNGWRDHNTLGSIVFNEDSDLSDAGSLKVQWILTQAPKNQRVIYVKSGVNPEQTSLRVESVQLAVSQLVPTGPLPQIIVTDIEPPTASGAYETLINRALIRTTPSPRLIPYTGLNSPSRQQVAPGAANSGGGNGGGGGNNSGR